MPSEEEVTSVLESLAQFVVDIGDEVLHQDLERVLSGTLNKEVGELELRGHICNSNRVTYYIGAHQDFRGVLIAYHLSLTESIAAEFSKDQAESILDGLPGDIQEGDPRILAAKYLIQEADPEEVRSFISYFRIYASDTNYHLNINQFDTSGLKGYSIERMIFPYEDRFTIKEFNDAVTTVISGGTRSSEILKRNVKLAIDEDNPTRSSITYM